MRTLIKVLELILIVLVVVTVTSCKKCSTCITTVTTTVTGQNPTTGRHTAEYCDDELKEIDGYTSTSTATVNGYTAKIVSSTVCN